MLYSPDRDMCLLLILISSAEKPEYLVNVDTPRTSKLVDTLRVHSTFKFPWPDPSVPIPTEPSFMLKDPTPTRKVAILCHLYCNCVNFSRDRCGRRTTHRNSKLNV